MGSISSCKLSSGSPSDIEGLKKLVLELAKKHNQLVGEVEALAKDLAQVKSKIKL